MIFPSEKGGKGKKSDADTAQKSDGRRHEVNLVGADVKFNKRAGNQRQQNKKLKGDHQGLGVADFVCPHHIQNSQRNDYARGKIVDADRFHGRVVQKLAGINAERLRQH